jgi:GNAT superfamily N-acetyltransferase
MNHITNANKNDLPEILELMKLVQPHLSRSEALLDWQYFQSPGLFSKFYLLKVAGTGQLISTYGAVSQFARSSSKIVKTFMIQDVLTHPEHRGKGYLHTLAEHCLKDMKAEGIHGYTFPNELSQKSFFRTGWERAFLVPNRERSFEGQTIEATVDLSHFQNQSAFEIGEVLWSRLNVQCGIERNKAFLKWRYSKPNEKHLALASKDRFFIVLKFFNAPDGICMHLLDIIVGDQKEIPEILNSVFSYGQRNEAKKVTAWLPEEHPYAKFFDQAGLVLKTRPERFFYLHSFADKASWHLTQGDSDVY